VRSFFLIVSLFSTCSFAFDIPAFRNIDRVIVVILENTGFTVAQRQPFQKELASKGALLANYFALTHPSQPNYIGLIAGDILGVTGDSNFDLNAPMLGDLLERAGKNWKVYAEDYPGDATHCFLGKKKGRFARKHVPFLSFKSVQTNPQKWAKIVTAQNNFVRDAQNNRLPEVSFYIPNLDNDGHDTSPAYADRALRQTFGPMLANAAFMQRTLFVVTYDEDDDQEDNRVLTLLVGGPVQPGVRSQTRYDHYSLLRTFEEIFRLGTLGKNDQKAFPISDVWVH
jgi:hypothetical protein